MTEIVTKGMTPRAIAIGLALCIIFTVYWSLETMNTTYGTWGHSFAGSDFGFWAPKGGFGSWTYNLQAFLPFFFATVIVALLPRKYRLSPHESLVVLAMSVAPAFVTTYIAMGGPQFWIWAAMKEGGGPQLKEFLNPVLYGPATVVVSSLALIFWVFTMNLFALLWKRQWVDVERLSIPMASIPLVMIDQVGSETERPKILNKFLWIGFVVGLLYAIPPTLWNLEIITPFANWDVNHTIYPPLPNAGFYPGYNLIVMSLLFLVPQDILMTMFLAYFIMRIMIPPLGVWFLGWPDISEQGRGAILWYGPTMQYYGQFSAYWGLFSLGVWTLVFGWRNIVNIAKAAVSKPAAEKAAEEIRLQGFTTRTLLLMFLGSLLLQWLIPVALGANPAFMLADIVLNLILFFGIVRILLESGFAFTTTFLWNYPANELFWGTNGFVDAYASIGTKPDMLNEMLWTGFYTASYAQDNNSIGTLVSCRVASDTGTSMRDVVVASLGALAVSIFIGFAVAYWSTMTYGYTNWPWTASGPSEAKGMVESGAGLNNWMPHGPAWGPIDWTTAGIAFILPGIFWFLRTRFAWWPFHPLGVIVGFSAEYNYTGIWLMAIIVWIIKFAIFRTGGTKLYRKLLPLFVGIAMGGVFMSFIFFGAYVIPRWFKTLGTKVEF